LCRSPRWRSCKRQYLIQWCLIGDEFEIDELRSRRNQFLATQVQPRPERGLAVIAQALRVGHGDEEQIKGCGTRLAPIDEVIAHDALVNPTELRGHLAQPLWTQHSLDDLHCRSG